MNLVLDKKVNQRHKGAKEQTGHNLAVLGRAPVLAQGKTSQSPRQRRNQIGDHEDIMPVMVIGRCHVGPASAGEGPEQTNTRDHLRQGRLGTRGQDIPEEDEGETGTGGNGDENLEEGSLGISVANGGGDGRKPFIGVAVVFVLDDLPKVQRHSHYQGTKKCQVSKHRMRPGDPFSVDLRSSQCMCRMKPMVCVKTNRYDSIPIFDPGCHGSAGDAGRSAVDEANPNTTKQKRKKEGRKTTDERKSRRKSQRKRKRG